MLRVSNSDLIAHWPFREDLKDHSESGLSIQNHGVEIGESDGQRSAQFNGAETFLEVPCNLSIGTGDFSCAGWIYTEETEVVGDILSQFDPETRQGWQISVLDQYWNDLHRPIELPQPPLWHRQRASRGMDGLRSSRPGG